MTMRNRQFCATATKNTSHQEALPQRTDSFTTVPPKALGTIVVNKAENAPWFCTWLGIVRIWHNILGTERCVCPPHLSQKGCLMVRLASFTMPNVFTQEIRLVIAVLLLVLSTAVLHLMHLSRWIQNNSFVVFNSPCYLWTCLAWMWPNLHLIDYSCPSWPSYIFAALYGAKKWPKSAHNQHLDDVGLPWKKEA